MWIAENAEVFDKLIKPLNNDEFYKLLNLDELEDFLHNYKCLTGKRTFILSKNIIGVLE